MRRRLNLSVTGPTGPLRTTLTHQDVLDLHVLWSRDQRIPTASSRQRWAQLRGLASATVGGWFNRRRARQLRLEGDEALLTGSYELNPGSPSNVAPHEIPEKVQVRGSRARCSARTEESLRGGDADFGTGSERTDPEQNSDDLTNLVDNAAETTVGFGEESFPLPCRGDCVLCVSGAPRDTFYETLDVRC